MLSRLRTRAIVLVGVAAVLPVATLGVISIVRARRTLLDEAERGNRDLATRAAADLRGQVARFEDLLASLALALAPSTRLLPEQATSVLRSQRIETRELLALDCVDADGQERATGRAGGQTRSRRGDPAVEAALGGKVYRSPVRVNDDAVPVITIAVPVRAAGRVAGAVVATVDVTEMWTRIDRLRVGRRGYARVVGADGTLIAIGDAASKRRVFTGEKDDSSAIVKSVLGGRETAMRYAGAGGEEVLGVGVPVATLGWGLILEQPISEALEPYRPFRAAIFALSAALLAAAALAGWFGARSVVAPIEKLRLRAGEIARGLLDARVEVRSPEELAALGEAMNNMSADLIRLQEDVRKKERIATLGRLAAGLAHDLKHPVKALEGGAKLILERPMDPEARRVFAEVVPREFRRLERFLEDLRRVSRGGGIEFTRERLDAAAVARGFAEELRRGGAPACVEIVCVADGAAFTVGNRELLERVLSNLASNAFEAMEGEGRLTLSAAALDGRVEVRVADTGPGIATDRLVGLFSEFETTKRRGLGLGLAVCQRIVADHGGTIHVESAPGRGAIFVVRLPLAPAVAA
jgi:two-component system NtrC family sensor kinase